MVSLTASGRSFAPLTVTFTRVASMPGMLTSAVNGRLESSDAWAVVASATIAEVVFELIVRPPFASSAATSIRLPSVPCEVSAANNPDSMAALSASSPVTVYVTVTALLSP